MPLYAISSQMESILSWEGSSGKEQWETKPLVLIKKTEGPWEPCPDQLSKFTRPLTPFPSQFSSPP